MIRHQLNQETGILVVSPDGSITADDFAEITEEVDAFLESHGVLRGLMIHSEGFPGWVDFSALVSHLRFIRDHHRQIQKVAAVSDDRFLAIMPSIVDHFMKAEVRHFAEIDHDQAMVWLLEDGARE
ncbi:MAG: STAS/SEC14 domain-containing protein [Blastopirellula sp.]|nr:MAG: STAS/SEC14 domain-containing protein [Blastopirellula sp.]